MPMERVPYLVGGGFEHSAEVMRAALAASTSGAEGVLGGGDFRVTPTPVPGTSIVVGAGNALIRNSYVGGSAQTYAVRAPSQSTLPIQATSSAGPRTDLVIARIDDPTYSGTTFDPAIFEAARLEVISGVPANQAGVAGLGLTYPAIALARVTLPASTGTVTAAMITDLRSVALPRRERRLVTVYPAGTVADGTAHRAYSTGYASWPIRADERPRLLIPSWATQLQIVVSISGAYYVKGASVDSVLGMRTGFGTTGSQNGIAIETTTGRHHYTVVGTHPVPENVRGTEQLVNVQAQQTRGDGVFWADYQTSVAIDVEWSEVAG